MSVQILKGDCREILKTLPDESVHCVISSPPYFGLRDYGTAQWDGGDSKCDHLMKPNGYARDAGRDRAVSGGTFHDNPQSSQLAQQFKNVCEKCGARRIDSQIGLEQSPEVYVATMVAVFREVRRVLRDDGTVWLNLGDSYAVRHAGGRSEDLTIKQNSNAGCRYEGRVAPIGLKPKDLIGIPWRVAFALQADGWYLRSDIIWSKPNPMPESVTDRCTKAHEYIFLLSKSARYFYDADAIAEPAKPEHFSRYKYEFWTEGTKEANGAGRPDGAPNTGGKKSILETRNKRSVWEVATAPFSEAHFATFPPALIEPCILAGCPKGGTVLDPFGGAGTTGLVADRLGRNAILIELNPEYAAMAERRIKDDAPLFAQVAAE